MALEVIGTKEQVQYLRCTTSDTDLPLIFNKGEDAESFLISLEKDARKYTFKELEIKYIEWSN